MSTWTVKGALSNWKTDRRARRLWEEFVELSGRQSIAANEKLQQFLDAFKDAHSELDNGEPMDQIVGDCSEILRCLLATLDADGAAATQERSLQVLLNSALEVVELILRDDKYRQIVKETPILLSQMVTVLSAAWSNEAKRLALRMISSFGSGAENKMLIGKQGAFQRMLKLLIEGDEDLSREVLKTLKHFLDVEVACTSHVGDVANDQDDDSMVGVIGGFALSSRKRVFHAVSGFTQIAFGEVNRIFPNNSSDKAEEVGVVSNFPAGTTSVSNPSLVPAGADATIFPPSRGALHLAYSGRARTRRNAHTSSESVRVSMLPDDSDESTLNSGAEDQVMKDFMRMEGVVSALTECIASAPQAVQLEMMQTISQLLLRNPRNQDEFRDCNGYSTLSQIFGRISDCSSAENRVFLEDLFDTIFTIAMDGNTERAAANPDAMKLLVDIAFTATQVEVQLHAVRCLQDLLSANYTNAAVLHSVHGDTTITHALLCNTSSSSSVAHTPVMQALVALLEYMMFLLSPHNLVPLWNLVNLIAQAQCFADLNVNMEIALLRVLSNVICDLRARCVHVSLSKLLPCVTKMLRGVMMSNDRSSDAQRGPKMILLMEIAGSILRTSLQLEVDGHEVVPLFFDAILRQRNKYSFNPGEPKNEDQTHAQDNKFAMDSAHDAGCCQTVAIRHFALWLLHDVVISASAHGASSLMKWMVPLLRAQLDSKRMKILIFEAVRAVGLSSTAAKRDFRIAGGLEALSCVLLDDDACWWHNALQAINAMIRDCEENKVYFIENILQGNFAGILRNAYLSGREINLAHFHMILEITCTGPVYRFLFNLADQHFKSVSACDRGDENKVNSGSRPAESQGKRDSAACWTQLITNDIARITDPSFLFPAGPPPLSRPYAFLIALQRQRERVSGDDDGTHSPRVTTDFLDIDAQSQRSDSASESSSMRDSIEVASRDLALQALLKASGTDHKPPRWWELGRNWRRERADDKKSSEHASTQLGINEQPDSAPVDQDDRMIKQQSSYLDFQGIKALDGSMIWRPDQGWTNRHQRAVSARIASHGTVLPPKITIRGHEALTLLLNSILLARKAVQPTMIATLIHLAASGLAARRALYHAGGLRLFLELSQHPRFAESEQAQRLVHVMVAVIGRYTISAAEVRRLFVMAYTVRSPHKQHQLLQVIAAIAQRWEPTAMIQFNGPVPGLQLQQLDKFPKPHTGYTLCAWIRLRTLLEPGENLIFCWKDSRYIILELFVRVWPYREDEENEDKQCTPRRNLCARMRNSPCTHTEYFTFDGYSFDSLDTWYHLVVTHHKHLLTLYVDGRFVQSFQPLNYPVGISAKYPLRGVVGCPKSLDGHAETAFVDRTVGSFCGEIGLLHITEGVWDAASAEATAKGFPYQRSLQAVGVNHRQLLCVDPLSYAALPEPNADELGEDDSLGYFEHEEPSHMISEDRAAVTVEASSSSRLESYREVQRETARLKDDLRSHTIESDDSLPLSYEPFTGPEYFSDFVVIQEAQSKPVKSDWNGSSSRRVPSPTPDSPNACLTSAAAVPSTAPVEDDTGEIESAAQAASASATPPIAPLSLSDELCANSSYPEMLHEGIRITGQSIRLLGDVDIHHAGSIHDVAQEVGNFYLPLPFLLLSRPQRALGWRILLEMLYGSDCAVKTFKDVRASTVLLHVIRTRSAADKNLDTEFDAIFEMLREGTLPVEDCMRLTVDLLLVEHAPLSSNMRYLRLLSDIFTGAAGTDELDRERLLQAGVVMLRKWKDRGGGMVAAMDLLSRSSGEVTELLLDIIKLMWQPTFTTEDLEMMLEFCLGSVEGKILALFDESDSEDDEYNSEEMENDFPGPMESNDNQELGGRAMRNNAEPDTLPRSGCNVLVPHHTPADGEILSDSLHSRGTTTDVLCDQTHENPSDLVQGQGCDDAANLLTSADSHIFNDDYVNWFEAEIDEDVVRDLGIAGCDFSSPVAEEDVSQDSSVRLQRPDGDGQSEAEDYAARIVETKVKVLIFLRELLVAKAPDTAVELLRGAGGFQVLFGLLSSPDERSRILALDLFALMLCHGKPADAKAFSMIGGFETVGRYLVRHWVSLPVGRALLSLAVRRPGMPVDTIEWLEGSHLESILSSISSTCSASSESDEDEDSAPRVGNFEALYCLLQLLQFGTTDMPVAREIAENIQEILLTPANLELLLLHNFTDWVLGFLAKVQRHASSHRAGMHQRSPIYQLVTRTLGSLVLHHVPHFMVPKVVKQLRRAIVDAAEFGLHVFDEVLTYYESNPILKPHEGSNTVKNLASMFEQIDEQTDMPVETYVRIVRLINDLACRNDSSARNIMKLSKLLDTRDILMLHCLKCDSSMEARYELAALPFESVVDHPTFRDKHGLLYLLRHMHLAQSDPALQVLFAGVIKNVFGTVEENRKLIARTMDDDEVNTRLLGNSSSDNVNQWLRILPGKEARNPAHGEFSEQNAGANAGQLQAAAPEWMALDRSPARATPTASSRISVSPVRQRPVSPSSSATSFDEDERLANEFTDCEEFLDWYYSPDQDARRDLIDSRISKALGPSDRVWRKVNERQTATRQKGLRSRIEIARGREIAALDHFNEEDKKVRAKVKKMGANHIRRVQQSIADRRSRRRDVRSSLCRAQFVVHMSIRPSADVLALILNYHNPN